MAATLVQETKISDNVAQTPSAAMSVSCSAGHAVILLIALVTKTRTVSSVADSASNAGWVHVVGGGGSTSGFCDIWWNPSLASSITTITLSYSGTSKCQVGVLEVSGLTGVADSGATSTNHTVAATTAAESITTANADDLIVAGFGAVTAASSVASPFTLSAGASGGAGVGINMSVGTVEELTTGTYTATFTSVSEVSTTAIAGFKVASTVIPPRKAIYHTSMGLLNRPPPRPQARLPRTAWR